MANAIKDKILSNFNYKIITVG